MQESRQPSARVRVLGTALDRIRADGLTVGLDHVSFEDVIAASGVSRATAYRIWPTKSDFLADVIVAAVEATHLVGEGRDDFARLAEMLDTASAGLLDPAKRRTFIVEALRVSIEWEVDRLVRSGEWTTYLALTATAHGLPPGRVRDEVTAALRAMDLSFTTHRARVYEAIARMAGYRLVPPLAGMEGFLVLSEATGAQMTGFVIKAKARPDVTTRTRDLAMFGQLAPVPWTVPALSLVGTILSFLEDDPAMAWDEARVAEVRGWFDDLERAEGGETWQARAMSDASGKIVSASRVVAAPAADIFELIADPAEQPRWDGNDNLAEAAAGQRVRAVGDVFETMLTLGSIRQNHVVEFEEGRLIAWKPSPVGERQPGHLWRWELEDLGDEGTRVTHTYDWTNLDDETRVERAKATTSEKLMASVDRLAALAEG